MVPAIRFPNPGTNETKKFIRVYAEPGCGVRAGPGAFVYYSGKVMIALMSTRQIVAFSGVPISAVLFLLSDCDPAINHRQGTR